MVNFQYLCTLAASATHANRGNVAIIVWNTLEAPHVWDVTSTEFEGSINLSAQEKRSLLSIYFRDFMYNNELKEVEQVTVEKTPSMVKDLGDRQVAFNMTDWEISADAFKTGAPRRNAETSTYVDNSEESLSGLLVAYVPENVWEDLDSLYGKELTVIFGDENEVALIAVTNDEVIDNEFVTKYDDGEITIAGEKYKFVDDAAIYVNNVAITSEEPATKEYDEVLTETNGILDTLGQTEGKTFTKNVKANVVLNSKGKITRLDLYVSGDYETYLTKEFVVGKVRSEKIYANNNSTIVYDFSDEDLEEEDLARVYIDGKKATLEEIEVGDVLTVYYEAGHYGVKEYVSTIYVARNTVNGEVSSVKNKLAIRLDGETYLASSASPLLTEDELKDASKVEDVLEYAEETVTLYLNIYGEYVLVAADEVITDYQFGIINYVYDEIKENAESDFTVYSQNIKVFMPDGNKVIYTVVYDDADYEDADGTELGYVASPETTLVPDAWDKNHLIAFSANADKEIKTEDIINVTLEAAINDDDCTEVDGYDLIPTEADTEANYDDMRIFVGEDTYRFKNDSVIMNANAGKPEIATWKKLVGDQSEDVVVGEGWTIICKEKDSSVKYIFLDDDAIADSEAKYAVILDTNYTGRLDGKKYTDLSKLFTEEDETVEYSNNGKTITEDTVVTFSTSGNNFKEAVTVWANLAKLANIELDGTMTNDALAGKAIAGEAATYKHAAGCTSLANTESNGSCATCEDVATAWKIKTLGACTTHHVNDIVASATLDCKCTAVAAYKVITVATSPACSENHEIGDLVDVEDPTCGCDTEACYKVTVVYACPTHTQVGADCAETLTCGCTNEASAWNHAATCTAAAGTTAASTCANCERVVNESAIAAATKEAYTVSLVDGSYIEYVELEDVQHVADVKVDVDEVIVLDVTGYVADGEWTPVVRSFSDIKEGDLVAAFDFDEEKKEYKLLVIFAD